MTLCCKTEKGRVNSSFYPPPSPRALHQPVRTWQTDTHLLYNICARPREHSDDTFNSNTIQTCLLVISTCDLPLHATLWYP